MDPSFLRDGLSPLSAAASLLTASNMTALGSTVTGAATDSLLRGGLSALSSEAATLTGWSLAMLAATVAGIVSSQYLQPSGRIRYFYLLFLPGWICLGSSIHYGDKIARRFAAAAFAHADSTLQQIGQAMNSEYVQQRSCFHWAVLAFGLWIAFLLMWWIFVRKIEPNPKS